MPSPFEHAYIGTPRLVADLVHQSETLISELEAAVKEYNREMIHRNADIACLNLEQQRSSAKAERLHNLSVSVRRAIDALNFPVRQRFQDAQPASEGQDPDTPIKSIKPDSTPEDHNNNK